MKHLVVQSTNDGMWEVHSADSSLYLFRGDLTQAEAFAREVCASEGGAVQVLGPEGAVLKLIELPATGTGEEIVDLAESALDVAAKAGVPAASKISTEGKQLNRVLEWGLPIIGAFGSTWLSPAVTEYGYGWIGIFVATLTWSLGVAGAVFFVTSQKLAGIAAVNAALFSLVGALIVANVLGVGMLSVEFSSGGGPGGRVLDFFLAALLTYGVIGTLVSGGIGAWLGWRLSREHSSQP
jgi:hypothetical protein